MLTVTGLKVIATGSRAQIVRGVDLTIDAGRTLALVGESGCGKTATALGIMGFARPGTRIVDGRVVLGDTNLLGIPMVQRQRSWGRDIAFVPQNPATALNPSLRIAAQMKDLLEAHGPRRRVAPTELFESVGLPATRQFVRRYPHQLSGGQQQRVLIAMALSCRPKVIVLDEPTTGLDVTTQAQVLEVIRNVRDEFGVALLYVTHDLAVVAQIADQVAVMYAGSIVETAPCDALFSSPRHPYTARLLDAVPDLDAPRSAIAGIAGSPPDPATLGRGCAFAARCEFRQDPCLEPQRLESVAEGRTVRCVRSEALKGVLVRTAQVVAEPPGHPGGEPLLVVDGLRAGYGRGRDAMIAAEDVSFAVGRGECLAIVGESGSGKTTIARAIAGLHREWDGEVRFDGTALERSAALRTTDQRRRIQIVFQNPDRSLNPQHSIGRILARPIELLLGQSSAAARTEALELLGRVGLPERYATRYPAELSGGERQRVAIARALGPRPDLLICDEITSALDVSVQAAILELLDELRSTLSIAVLFISHDLAVVRHIADSVLVLRHGHMREQLAATALTDGAKDEYTRALLRAAPRLPTHEPPHEHEDVTA